MDETVIHTHLYFLHKMYPHFKKSHFLFQKDVIRLQFCLFEDVTDCRDIRKIICIHTLHYSVRFINSETALRFSAINHYHQSLEIERKKCRKIDFKNFSH